MIKKRGNSWWVVVYTGRDPLTGKKRQKTGTAKTRAEARQLEARLIREAGTGQHRAAGNKMVAELLDAWSEWRPRKGEITERTMLGYRSVIEHKIIPALGELRLSRVDTATIDRFLAQLSERGTRCKHCQHLVRIGQAPLRAGDRYRPRPGLREREHPTDCVRGLPMSPSAVRDVHAVLSGAFKQAQSPLCHPGRRASAWTWPTCSRLAGRRPASPSRPPPITPRCWPELAAALVLWRRAEQASPGGPGASRNALACSCGCGRRIRVARSVLELASIMCAACAEPFEPEDDGAG